MPEAPQGTFAPGTKVQVGSWRVVVERYLSEGGFAHVYLVRLPKSVNGEDMAVLKRVAVPDKDTLASMRTEVETMKKLKGRRHIVTYFDSHVSQLQGQGFEVFLLMEYCNGGGLIDYMNTRLQNRLTEPEILQIFADVSLGVSYMHYLRPPLLHRDLKIENVLISQKAGSTSYKVCDFGSTAETTPAATNATEGRRIEEDVQRHTTLQYRSPEMIDVYRHHPIDEKSDIWALGVFLYKLCYYKTPFEEQGQMAILNASYTIPSYPSFSSRLKGLIGSSYALTALRTGAMLSENPHNRPTIYEVVAGVAAIRGTDVPLRNIYSKPSHSPVPSTQKPLPKPPSPELLPKILPMRRGRPSPPKADPFQSLDPARNDFALLHEKGRFSFSRSLETNKPSRPSSMVQLAPDNPKLPPNLSTRSSCDSTRTRQSPRDSHDFSQQDTDSAPRSRRSIFRVPSKSKRTGAKSLEEPDISNLHLDSVGKKPGLVVNTSETNTENITSDVDYLKTLDEKDGRKRASLPSVSLSGTKSLLAGKFGEAFRRFETGVSSENDQLLSSIQDSPIASSESKSDDGHAEQTLSPEAKRDLERLQLAQEERRVRQAAAAYKLRVKPGERKAADIQSKVQRSLYPPRTSSSVIMTSLPAKTVIAEQASLDDLEAQFSQKYPDLDSVGRFEVA